MDDRQKAKAHPAHMLYYTAPTQSLREAIMPEQESKRTRHAHQFRNMMTHPKTCPNCDRVWEYESANDCRCTYCKWRLRFDTNLHEGETKLFKMFIPIVTWVLLGLAILWFIGRRFNG